MIPKIVHPLHTLDNTVNFCAYGNKYGIMKTNIKKTRGEESERKGNGKKWLHTYM
jgi:hypothetical protein